MHTTTTSTTVPVGTAQRTDGQPAAGVYGPPNNRPGRGFIVGVLSSIAIVFWLIAMTTPIAMVDYELADQGRLSVDPWHACNKPEDGAVAFCRPMGHADEECTGSRDTFRVEQAFLILTGLMLFPLLVVAALDFSHKLNANTPDLPFGLHTHGWTIFFGFATAMVSLIAFAVGFAIPRMDPCNNGSLYAAPNFEWGPSPIFSLLIFLISIVIIIVALVLREDGTVKTSEEIAHPHSPIVHPHEPMAGTRPAGGTFTHPAHQQAVTRPVVV